MQFFYVASTMHLNGIAPDKEVTGSSFNNFVKFCLKVIATKLYNGLFCPLVHLCYKCMFQFLD